MIIFLEKEHIIKINRDLITMYSVKEDMGVKDVGLLESAINRPKQSAFEKDGYETVFDKAAALFESLAKNHPFYNGNKRTAFTSLVVFLYINGYSFNMEQKQAEDFTVDMVNNKYAFEEISNLIKDHCQQGNL